MVRRIPEGSWTGAPLRGQRNALKRCGCHHTNARGYHVRRGVRSSTVPLLRNAVATSCSARATAARKPPPSPCPSPTSPPRPRPRRCNASPRPTARTRGREARTPPPPSIPPRPCAANLTPLASCPPQIPPPLATKPRTPRRLVSPCPRHIPREDDERRERARRDRASGAERVIGRELPSRVDEHSLNVSLHTTGRARDR